MAVIAGGIHPLRLFVTDFLVAGQWRGSFVWNIPGRQAEILARYPSWIEPRSRHGFINDDVHKLRAEKLQQIDDRFYSR